MSIESYLRAAPKAELHVHLEGSIQPATLLTLAQRNNVDIPAKTLDDLRQWFVYRDFTHFVEIYISITRCLRTAEDYELIAYEFGAEMARQNTRYAEVTFTPGTHHSLGVPFDIYFSGLTRGRERARQEFGVEIGWIFDIVRNIEGDERNRQLADYTTNVAIEGKNDGVVALGLGGDEASYPPSRFAPNFARARAAGLHSIPHAGEIAGPSSVWSALEDLGAERIGHGVRSIEDPRLVTTLAESGVPLEVCPTSNIRLGVFPDIAHHPLPLLLKACVSLTINSDDPPLFNTTLNDEVLLLHTAFNLEVSQIDDILLNGVRSSFQSVERRRVMEQQFRDKLTELKRQEL